MQAHSLSEFGRAESPVRDAGLQSATLRTGLIICALLAFWLLCHPYFGNMRGSLIYTARALADLDPGGVGRDAMFQMDGQSGYTIFRPLFASLTAALGAPAATMATALAASLFFFAAAVALAWRLAEGRTRYLIIILMATLPSFYGGFRAFAFAEASATPRPFAEALVLFGLVALLAKRLPVAFACMALAAAFHPIMALAGIAVLAIWTLMDDRRWLWAWIGIGSLALMAAAAGIAPFDRIIQPIDAQWLEILVTRSPLLFPDLWAAKSVGRIVAKSSALLIAASFAPPQTRKLFMIVVLVGASGIIAAHILGDRLHLLLAIQAQTWRFLWIVSALGSAAAALCVVELWSRDQISRLTLVFLGLSLVLSQYGIVSSAFAATALALRFGLTGATIAVPNAAFWGIIAIAACLLLFGVGFAHYQIHQALSLVPADMAGKVAVALGAPIDLTLVAVAAAIWVVAIRWRPPLWSIAGVAAVAAIFVAFSWDRRSEESAFTDRTPPLRDLQQALASRPGEIYWVNGIREPWSWAGRPAWVSAVQGASVVFSRDLAMQFYQRSQRVIAAGLGDDELLTPLTAPHLQKSPPVLRERVRAFCGERDAPAWIVLPLAEGEHAAAGETEWTAPVERIQILDSDGLIDWQSLRRYALIPCGG